MRTDFQYSITIIFNYTKQVKDEEFINLVIQDIDTSNIEIFKNWNLKNYPSNMECYFTINFFNITNYDKIYEIISRIKIRFNNQLKSIETNHKS